MDRRRALKVVGAAAAVGVTGTAMMAPGCSTAQIENGINVVIEEVSNILAAVGQSGWSTQLSNALSALESAEATWKTGGAVAIVIDALNAVMAVTAVIPFTDAFSPLIDVVVAAVEAVLNLLPAPAAVAGSPELRARAMSNPRRGRVAAFKSPRQAAQRWNETVAGLPALHVARVKVPL